VSAEFKSQTSIEDHSIAHIVCLLTKSHSQQNSDLNETQSNKPRELNRRRLDDFDDCCNSHTSLDKDR